MTTFYLVPKPLAPRCLPFYSDCLSVMLSLLHWPVRLSLVLILNLCKLILESAVSRTVITCMDLVFIFFPFPFFLSVFSLFIFCLFSVYSLFTFTLLSPFSLFLVPPLPHVSTCSCLGTLISGRAEEVMNKVSVYLL